MMIPSMAKLGFTGGVKRYIILDAVPLYCMLSLACGACVYSCVRSSMTATDITWAPRRREDFFYEDDKVESESKLYGKGLLYSVSTVRDHPEVLPFHSAMVNNVMADLPEEAKPKLP